jgi:hypothetical protein
MVILKFTLLFFLLYLAWMVVLRQNSGSPYGGPFYYADPLNSNNPVQPRYRLNFKQAWSSDRFVEVYTNEAGQPLLAKHFVGHQLASQMVWIWTQSGQLMRRYFEDPQGRLLIINVLPVAGGPEIVETPAF